VIVAAGVHGDIEPGITSASLGLPCLPGEIEASVPWLAQRLGENGGHLESIDLQKAPRQVIPNDLPTPAYESVDMSAYVGEIVDEATRKIYFGRAGLVFANRGCPYTCSYCFVWFGRKLRIRDPQKVLQDILAQRDSGTRHFFFLDYTFTFDRAWTLELCKLLRTQAPDVTWVCQTRCENVDADILSAMRAGGCVGVFYGIETPWIAGTTMRKRTKREVIDKALEDTVTAGLHPFVFVLLGLEGYSSERRDELLSWLRDLPATFSARPLLPRPHTRLFPVPAGQSPKSWPELEEESVRLGNEYWPPELDDLQRQLLALPNNVLNAPHERAAA
jgi:radical SAM superfamily enzyme YgiQ (UPF0313 family)